MTATLLPVDPEPLPGPAAEATPAPDPGAPTRTRTRRAWSARLSSLTGDLVECLLLTLAVGAAAVPWRFFYTGDVVGPAALTAAAAAVAVLLLRRAPWWAATFLALVVSLVAASTAIAVAGAGSGQPGLGELREVLRGVVHGWADLLTVTVPADFAGEVAVPPLLLAGVATTAATLVALRTRLVLLPLAAPVASFVTALVFTSWTAAARENGPQYTLAAVIVGLLGVELFLRTNRIALRVKAATLVVPDGAVVATPLEADSASAMDATADRARAGVSRLFFGAPAVAAVIGGAIALAVFLPVTGDREPYDPAAAHHEEIEIDLAVSPLATVKSQLTRRPSVTLFSVRVQQPTDRRLALDRIRTAALTEFDGAVWSVSGVYRRAGSVLPSPVIPESQRATATVTVASLPKPFLPALASPDTVRGAGDVGYDQASGVLVSERPSLRGLTYTQTASVVTPGDKLTELHPAAGPAEALELPQRPDWLQQALQATGAAGRPTTLEQLKAIEQWLRGTPYVSTATSGHSYFRIRQLLLGKEPADAAGYAEQRASAFAVLARSLGVPTRVSVGYLLRNRAADGSYKVTTADVTAWPEVLDSRLGWVAFNPTGRQAESAPVKPDEKGSPTGGANSGDQAPQNDLPPVLFDREEPPPVTESGWRAVLKDAAMIAAGGLAAALLLLLACGLAKPARRAWRRGRGGPTQRTLAAWREIGDRLTERGHRPDATFTPTETVLASRELVPVGALQTMAEAAPLVSAALYAPYDPPETQVARAWELEAATRGELRRATPLRARLRTWFSPRPLLPRAPRRPRLRTRSTRSRSDAR